MPVSISPGASTVPITALAASAPGDAAGHIFTIGPHPEEQPRRTCCRRHAPGRLCTDCYRASPPTASPWATRRRWRTTACWRGCWRHGGSDGFVLPLPNLIRLVGHRDERTGMTGCGLSCRFAIEHVSGRACAANLEISAALMETQKTITRRPRTPPASSRRCASAARSGGNVWATRSVSRPSATSFASPVSAS
jgi:hypothetical protein